VREQIPFVTVIFNDDSLSLIHVAQRRRGLPNYGVDYGHVDFAAAAAGFGVWARRVATLPEFDAAMREALTLGAPAVIDALIDPTEYHQHIAPAPRTAR
jgi:acetolactate synthase-1/2/3 large subunit